ncbi:hypothetical protein GGX14DRAFT_412214 [Mycena pura]|uniref:Phospholipid/glycerol acyltransferase domain-containing protein n=1 Tax=Mycena pura TaxID=153505 RepID=A0AAD6YS46_9AGAR|nr:hypothetical protein GGX14DRAFT_412214 [Mycena pura]
MAALLSVLKPVAYASLPLLALQYSPRGRYYTRTLVYVSTMGFVATLASFIAAGMSLAGRRYDVNYAVARTFYCFAGTILGLRVEVEGEEYLRDATDGGGMPAVLMVNHQSMLDILPMGRCMPKRTSIMSKKSLQFTPLGPFMTMSGAIFIDRGNSTGALRSLDAAVGVMRSLRVSLWMFPEGTRHSSEAPAMLSFKKGGFHLAIQAGFPIIPLVVENYWHLFHKNTFESGVIRVRVLPPVPTAGLTVADIPDLSARVREQMLAALVDISRKVSSAPPPERPAAPAQEQPSATEKLSSVVSEQARAMPDDAVFEGRAHGEAALGVAPVPSRESLASSGSENGNSNGTGTETEEDEGMVIVGRPA